MAAILPTNPIVMNGATVKIGTTNNYEATVSTVSIVPTTPTTSWTSVNGTVITVAGTPTWVINLTFLQDFKTANSLSQYLLTNAGQTQPIAVAPAAGTGNTLYTISAVLVPSQIGGDTNALLSASVTLQCIGQPVASTL